MNVRNFGARSIPARGTASENSLHPGEVTQLTICMHIMQVWRHDSVMQQLQALAERPRRAVPSQLYQGAAGIGVAPDWMTQHQFNPIGLTQGASDIVEITQQVGRVRAR